MRKLHHRNIVDYIGIGCTDKSSEAMRRSTMFLVSELLEGGTLKRLVMDQMMTPHKRVQVSLKPYLGSPSRVEGHCLLHLVIPSSDYCLRASSTVVSYTSTDFYISPYCQA